MIQGMSTNTHIEYECRQCGACCRLPGIVRLQPEEIGPMADYLGIPLDEFIARFTMLAPDRAGLILTEQPDGACVFLENNLCRVHAAKPLQCQDFPGNWNFDGFEKICQARKIYKPDTHL